MSSPSLSSGFSARVCLSPSFLPYAPLSPPLSRRPTWYSTLWWNAHQDVSELVALMANTSMAAELDGLSESARASAFLKWLRAEDDAAVVDETVDMVLAGESDG